MKLGLGRFKRYGPTPIRPEPIRVLREVNADDLKKQQIIPWPHKLLGITEAMKLGRYTNGRTDKGVAVPIFDLNTGRDDHPDLGCIPWATKRYANAPTSTRRLVTGGIDCTEKDWEKSCWYRHRWTRKNWRDCDHETSHGTTVAGVIAALNNEIGILGGVPNADLWAIRVFAKNGLACYDEWLAAGIEAAIRISAQFYKPRGVYGGVINMALGSHYALGRIVRDAMVKAVDAGFIIMASAGNDGDTVNYPAAWPEAIAWGALNRAGKRTDWSSTGAPGGMLAPGESIWTTARNGMYAEVAGTSYAVDYGSCIGAWMKARYPGQAFNTFEARKLLAAHSQPIESDFLEDKDWRILNAAELSEAIGRMGLKKFARRWPGDGTGRDFEISIG